MKLLKVTIHAYKRNNWKPDYRFRYGRNQCYWLNLEGSNTLLEL